MTDEIYALAMRLQLAHPEWRWGQTLFNALYTIDVELGDQVRATDADPFFDDANIAEFWRVLQREYS